MFMEKKLRYKPVQIPWELYREVHDRALRERRSLTSVIVEMCQGGREKGEKERELKELRKVLVSVEKKVTEFLREEVAGKPGALGRYRVKTFLEEILREIGRVKDDKSGE